MGAALEILLAVGIGLFVLIGIGCGIKANRENKRREEHRNMNNLFQSDNAVWSNSEQQLQTVLEIYTKTFFYQGMPRRDVVAIFERKGIQPIWNNREVLAYLIPNARFEKRGNNMTYIGRGTDSYVWAFQFDSNSYLLQQGVMPPKD